ncbi:hypothetical protein FEM48_Zijuj01G0164400 [Ziziphus jujuba var. spinosa]|uniref:Uncharacterized protein n=1 Tax=Ziziphus jujuba var. spinosa TaxID=714518 RepID=A0A978W2B2_ZIZJJ|nr:hypothetical protein FEM48_Zijuj01G0164400 [Ziziphus jujuba var. spinosa]
MRHRTSSDSKLTPIPVADSTQEITDSELRGLLAPLLHVQLRSRDAITAYSIEDNRLGQRQFLNLMAHRILRFRDLNMEIRNVLFTSKIVGIPIELKELIINGIEDLVKENYESKPIGNDDEWGMKRNAITIRSSN